MEAVAHLCSKQCLPRHQLTVSHGNVYVGNHAGTLQRSYLRYKETCKRDMKMVGIYITNWKTVANDRGYWRSVVQTGMERREDRKRHNWLRGGITESRADYVCHITELSHCGANHCHTRQMDDNKQMFIPLLLRLTASLLLKLIQS